MEYHQNSGLYEPRHNYQARQVAVDQGGEEAEELAERELGARRRLGVNQQGYQGGYYPQHQQAGGYAPQQQYNQGYAAQQQQNYYPNPNAGAPRYGRVGRQVDPSGFSFLNSNNPNYSPASALGVVGGRQGYKTVDTNAGCCDVFRF